MRDGIGALGLMLSFALIVSMMYTDRIKELQNENKALRVMNQMLADRIAELTTDDETWPKELGHPDPIPANCEMQEIGVL